MLIRSAKFKVQGGKLFEVRVDFDQKINNVQILGDFFIHPEEGLREIELLLTGMQMNEDEAAISQKVRDFAEANQITLIGITPEAIASSIVGVIKG